MSLLVDLKFKFFSWIDKIQENFERKRYYKEIDQYFSYETAHIFKAFETIFPIELNDNNTTVSAKGSMFKFITWSFSFDEYKLSLIYLVNNLHFNSKQQLSKIVLQQFNVVLVELDVSELNKALLRRIEDCSFLIYSNNLSENFGYIYNTTKKDFLKFMKYFNEYMKIQREIS